MIFFRLHTPVGYVTFKNVRLSDYRYSQRHKHGIIYTRIIIHKRSSHCFSLRSDSHEVIVTF